MVSGVRPRVVVVEDDESVARMLEFSLREAGFDTVRATNGGEALHILEQQPPDAAVLDLRLPNDQGGTVLDWLWKSEQQAAIAPVWVVISALDRREATTRYGSLGGYFLAKPFDPWDLVAIIENRVSARREA